MSAAAPLAVLEQMLNKAIDVARPENCLPRYLPSPPTRGQTYVIGAGKAAAVMAQTLEAHWPGPLSGTVVTRYDYQVDCKHIQILQAAHPVPDENSLDAARHIQAIADQATADDLIIMFISVCGTLLLCMYYHGLDLQEHLYLTDDVFHSD